MRVISQTGKTDVPYENFVFSILNSSGGNYGIVAVKNVAEPPEVFSEQSYCNLFHRSKGN